MPASGAKIDDYTTVMGPGQLPDIHRDPVAPQRVAYRGGFVDTLDAPTISEIAGCVGTGREDGLRIAELRHLGGAYARSGAAPSCVTGRDAHFNLYVTTQLTTGNAADAMELGSILRLWGFADADRILMVSKNLDLATGSGPDVPCADPRATGGRAVLIYDAPLVRAVSRVRRWRIIQAAERARQAIAHGATGCAVVSGVMAASSASQAVSQMANSMIWFRKPRRWRAVRP
jgi:hypothetical protein